MTEIIEHSIQASCGYKNTPADCLCEESCENWQYAVSDEFVYLDESITPLRDSGDIPAKIYGVFHGVVKIKFMLEGDRHAYYVGCISSINCEDALFAGSQVGKMQYGGASIRRNPPV